MTALVAEASDDEDTELEGEDGWALLAQIRADPGNVSLNTTREEIAKLTAIRSIGLPTEVFADITLKVLTGFGGTERPWSPQAISVKIIQRRSS
jgi:hypothetical protein